MLLYEKFFSTLLEFKKFIFPLKIFLHIIYIPSKRKTFVVQIESIFFVNIYIYIYNLIKIKKWINCVSLEHVNRNSGERERKLFCHYIYNIYILYFHIIYRYMYIHLRWYDNIHYCIVSFIIIIYIEVSLKFE